MLLEDLANPDPLDLDFYGPVAGLDELLASHHSDQGVSQSLAYFVLVVGHVSQH